MRKTGTFGRRARLRALGMLAPLALLTTGCVFAPGGGAPGGSSTPPPAPPPAPAAGSRIGVSSYLFWSDESDARDQLQRIRDSGVRSVRENFPWHEIEPAKGSFDWAHSDSLMAAAAAVGVDVLPILAYSAPWASSDPSGAGDIHYPPANPADYANFAQAVVARYGPNGSFWQSRPTLVPRPVQAAQLWNEPWGHWFWKPNPDPAGYARLVRSAGAAIRSVSPSVKLVVTGDVYQIRSDGSAPGWLDVLLATDPGVAAFVDAWAVHPYPDPFGAGPSAGGPWAFDRVTRTRDIAAAAGAARPIWITEIGWSTATGHPDGVSESTQASYIDEALGRALVNWAGFVERTFVFMWYPSSGDMSDWEGNLGLLRADGSTKPAWDVVRMKASGA
jgi:polysaccharide biosynthesis protein PslG